MHLTSKASHPVFQGRLLTRESWDLCFFEGWGSTTGKQDVLEEPPLDAAKGYISFVWGGYSI